MFYYFWYLLGYYEDEDEADKEEEQRQNEELKKIYLCHDTRYKDFIKKRNAYDDVIKELKDVLIKRKIYVE